MAPDDVAVSYWLEPLTPESMPMTAAKLLAEGYDSPTLREVAGLPTTDPVAVREAFVQALRELETYAETRLEAQMRVARSLCRDAATGPLPKARLVREICRMWDFDDIIHDGLPPAADDLATVCWLAYDDTYHQSGGDRRLDLAISRLSGVGAPPPPIFASLPAVTRIEPTDRDGAYRVTLLEPGGVPTSAIFTVREGLPVPVTNSDWDIFWGWPGDAASIRDVIRQIGEFHRRRAGP